MAALSSRCGRQPERSATLRLMQGYRRPAEPLQVDCIVA